MIVINAASLGCLNTSKLDSRDWTGSHFGEVSGKSDLGFGVLKVAEGRW